MSWSGEYKRSIDCDSPKGFSQKSHCAARKKRQRGEVTKSKSPFSEAKDQLTFTKFTHKTKHLSKSQHQLDPNLDLKHLVHHSVKQYVDRDADGDVDLYDNPKKKTPDENVMSAPDEAERRSKKLIAKQKGELKHTRRGMAYEETELSGGREDKKHSGDNAVDELETGLKKLNNTSYNSIDKLMRRIMKKYHMTAKQLHNAFVNKNKKTPDDWIKSKSISESRRDNKRSGDPGYSLGDWFEGGGWVQTGGKYDGKPCAKQPGQTTKPYCRDPDDRAAMSKEERNKRAAKKRREDPNPNRTGKAKMVTQESAGEKDACYKKVKSRYKVWPSAYASGALVKCRKVGAANWGNKTEELEMVRYCPACKKLEKQSDCKMGTEYWAMNSQPAMLAANQLKYDPNRPHPANEERDHEYSMARSELSTIISAAKRLKKKMAKGEGSIEAWVQSKITKAADYIDTAADYIESGEHNVDEAKKCWPGYEKKGSQKLFGKKYNRCVKVEEFSNWREELGLTEDWQKVNKSDRTDGMSKKAVDTYRRENPGSKLKTAVTEKNPKGRRAKRRKSFCARSKGQQDMHNIDCSKTPDKAICKARRRWRC